ncbi:MAG: indolepyruvate oxidoreductase subunit beta [Bacillota bacterium]|nr:indolepyruvate oxidoreductase subunit beta [Bacillota bacterium]
MNMNYLLCGVGGQGTVLAAKVLAAAAIAKGEEVKTTETIGMAQRGGPVTSYVRTGKDIHSPIIPLGKADVIIGFEPGEAVRNIKYLKKGGTVVVSSKSVMPVTAALTNSSYSGHEMVDYLKKAAENIIIVDGERICAECGSDKVLNVVLLGAAIKSGALGITPEETLDALLKRLPEKLHELNKKAFELGMRG